MWNISNFEMFPQRRMLMIGNAAHYSIDNKNGGIPFQMYKSPSKFLYIKWQLLTMDIIKNMTTRFRADSVGCCCQRYPWENLCDDTY